jgi:hypothetical protein
LVPAGPTLKFVPVCLCPQGLVPVFVDKTRTFVRNLHAASASGQVIKMHEAASLLTLDIICQVCVHACMHAQPKPKGLVA